MEFTDLDKKLSRDEITNIENELGISFPEKLRELFENYNGGVPVPYVLEESVLNTVINETLPLITNKGRGTAVRTYRLLVIERQITKRNFFPFAVDAGGDYFFVDCDTSDSRVYFFRSDSDLFCNRLIDLELTLEEFWGRLKSEE